VSGQDWLEKDFYRTLGVPKDASADAVKKAYRKLARKWHPDQNPGDTKAEEKFKEIGEAYAVLSDPEQRKQYDAIRAMAGGGARFSAGPGGAGGAGGFEDVFSAMFGGGAPGSTRVRYSTGGAGTGAGGADFEDLLSNLFGGAGGAGARANPFGAATGRTGARTGFGGSTARPGTDLRASTSLSFRQALEGATVRMSVEGTSMTVRIPEGVRDGQRIRLRGKGRPGTGGAPAGDLVVTIRVEPHPVYSRDGDDLRMHLPVSYPEAALGAKVGVPLPDGTTVSLKVPAGTASGSVLRVRRRGVRHGRTAGDLLVEIEVTGPKPMSRDQRKAVEQLARSLGDWDPREGLAERARV
jgi:molecular chaperone DnaJ